MDFDHILNRRGNGSMKWEDSYIQKRFQIKNTKDVYPLFIADMDFCMDEDVKNKLLDYVREPDFGYFHIQDSFYDSIINWYDSIHHIALKKEWIVPSLGTITSMHLLCDMLARNQDIVYFTPVYGPFASCAKLGNPIEVELNLKDHRYAIDFEALRDIFNKHDVKVLLLCHPHNPGGIMYCKDDLIRLKQLCKEYNVYILVDEIHGDLNINNMSFSSMIDIMDEDDLIVVSSSPNKTFNISALSTSFVLSKNVELLLQYEEYLNHLHLGCNRLGVLMIEYVYSYGMKWYFSLLEYLSNNMHSVYDLLKDSDIEIMKPDFGYLLWMYLPKIRDVDQFVLDLAKDTGVLVETGSRFVSHYQGWIRINVATNRELLEEAMRLFVDYYKGYGD